MICTLFMTREQKAQVDCQKTYLWGESLSSECVVSSDLSHASRHCAYNEIWFVHCAIDLTGVECRWHLVCCSLLQFLSSAPFFSHTGVKRKNVLLSRYKKVSSVF